MPHPNALAPADVERTLAAMAANRRLDGTYNVTEVGRALGISQSSARGRIQGLAMGRYDRSLDEPQVRPPEPEAPGEVRNASFWKARAKEYQARLGEAEAIAEELAGIRGVPISPPDFTRSTDPEKRHKAVGCILISDVHAGEVIDVAEVSGVNVYNPEICRQRLRQLFTGASSFIKRAGADCKLDGVVVFLAGDLVSGSIHLELKETNALTGHEQVKLVVEEVQSGIAGLLSDFGRVHVVSVPGNHGRTTDRPQAKMAARLSYDTLVASMLADRFKDDKRVTWQIPNSVDAIVELYGRSIFVTHGDRMGTGGGAGFAGPGLPLIRGHRKIQLQAVGSGIDFDLILSGHYHHSHASARGLGNGSVVGYSEYANGLRASVEPPQQWVFLIHERWGLRERIEIKLEEADKRKKPRISVRAMT